MMELFDFLNQVPYLPEVVTLLIAGHALAVAIVNMTDTPEDDKWVAKAYRYIEFVAGILRASKVKQPNPHYDKVEPKSPSGGVQSPN